MSKVHSLLFIASLSCAAASLSACKPTSKCSANSCNGCCSDLGQCLAGNDRETGDHAPQHTVPDDQIGLLQARHRMRVVARGREGQQNALLGQMLGKRDRAGSWQDDVRGGAAEQSSHIAEAFGARHEDTLADAAARHRAGFRDAPDGFVTRDQRVAHPRESWHAPGLLD